MFAIIIWTYWYLWAIVLAGLVITLLCSCWLWRRHAIGSIRNRPPSDEASAGSCYVPPHYSRCSSFFQALPPPYNEVSQKPDLYPLVIGYEEGIGKSTSGLVMRYFRSLSHTSTLDSLSSSFMCNIVNEANTFVPPPYSCNNSIDELSIAECGRSGNINVGSAVSLANHRTASDVSSLTAQSPCSPPRATTPTIEVQELLDKIQQLPQFTIDFNVNVSTIQSQPRTLQNANLSGPLTRPSSPGDLAAFKPRKTRGKMYMPLGLQNSRNKSKRWLSRSAPTTPCGTSTPTPFVSEQNTRPSHIENKNIDFQGVPLLSEQDEESHQV